MRFCSLIFSNLNPAATGAKSLPEGTHWSSQVIHMALELRIWIFKLVSFLALSSNNSSNSTSPYFFSLPKMLGSIYTYIFTRSLLLISSWLGVSNGDSLHIYCQIMPWTISLYFLLEIELLASLNLLRLESCWVRELANTMKAGRLPPRHP